MASKRTARPGERRGKSAALDAALGFHPTLRLRIEQLRPPRPESFREDIVFNFLRPASLKVEGPHAVGSRGPIFCLVVSIYPRFALLVFENL
jgi:hypothetical protein